MTGVAYVPQSSRDQRSQAAKARIGHIGAEFVKYFIVITLSASFAFPLFWMVSSALKNDSQVYPVPPILIPNPAHWNNFVDGWTRLPFTTFAINSIFRRLRRHALCRVAGRARLRDPRSLAITSRQPD